jgi:hypothetical protein
LVRTRLAFHLPKTYGRLVSSPSYGNVHYRHHPLI